MNVKNRLKGFLNGRSIVFVLSTILICMGLFVSVPRLLMPRPIIYALTPDEVMANSDFNSDKSIILDGENFDHLVAVYINGVWEPECDVVSQTEDTLRIILPPEYYREENKLNIQVQTKINSDLFGMSNKLKFTVLPDDNIKEPVISALRPDALSLDQGIIQNIIFEGENFNKNSVVTINDSAVKTVYTNNTLTVSVPFWKYYKEDEISLRVTQYYDGYATSVKSFPLYLEVHPHLTETDNGEELLQQNQQLMAAYLKALKNDDYIVIFSVKDESSCAVTDEIVAGLSELGLKENLKEAGVRNSYIAVLNGLDLVYEAIGKDILSYDHDFNGLLLHVESANFDAGSFSVIQLQGTEYSVNERGLNIVVYSKSKGMVIDCVSFDTFGNLSLIRE